MRLLTVAALTAVLLAVTVFPPVAAGQSTGTEYTGTHSGGGTIRFTVSAAGDRLTSLAVADVVVTDCAWELLDLANWGGAIEVHDNAFSATNADGDTITGAFPAPFRAEGTFQIFDPAAHCTSGVMTWTATAPAPVRAAPPVRAPAIQPTPGAVAPAPALGTRDAPFCAPGQQPSFHPGLAALKARLGDVMGVVLECEHLNNSNGDILQQTTTGLAYFRWASGLPTFTDGWRHWSLSGNDLIAWEGESPDPPAAGRRIMRSITRLKHVSWGAWGRHGVCSWLLALLIAVAAPLALTLTPTPGVAAQEACPEPNNEFQQACELRPGTPVEAVLATDGDVDAYRLEAVNFHARLRLSLTDGRLDHRVSLVNWNGDVLASSDQGRPLVVEQVVGPPGAYYVFVDSVTGLGEPTAPYRLSLEIAYPAGSVPQTLYSSAFAAGGNPGCTASHGPAGVACTQEGGRFTIELGEGSTESDPTSAWLWVGPSVSDFTFTVDTRLVKDARNAAVQIDVRAQDYDNGYGVALVPREGLVVISKTVGGQVTRLASASRPDITNGTGVNRLTVTAVGTAIHVGLNGDAVVGVSDSTFATGRVGFFAFTYDAPFVARIDNVLLTAPAMHPCPSPTDPSGAFAPCPP